MGLFNNWVKNSDNTTMEIDLTNGTVSESNGVKFNKINENAARKIIALNSGINLIGNSISTLPIYLYKRDKDGERIKVNDYRNYILNASPSDTTVAMNLKFNIIKNLILRGNSYIYIKRNPLGEIVRLEYIDNDKMTVEAINSL